MSSGTTAPQFFAIIFTRRGDSMRRRFQKFAARRNKTRYVLAGLLVEASGVYCVGFPLYDRFVSSWIVSAYQAIQANPWLILPYWGP